MIVKFCLEETVRLLEADEVTYRPSVSSHPDPFRAAAEAGFKPSEFHMYHDLCDRREGRPHIAGDEPEWHRHVFMLRRRGEDRELTTLVVTDGVAYVMSDAGQTVEVVR